MPDETDPSTSVAPLTRRLWRTAILGALLLGAFLIALYVFRARAPRPKIPGATGGGPGGVQLPSK